MTLPNKDHGNAYLSATKLNNHNSKRLTTRSGCHKIAMKGAGLKEENAVGYTKRFCAVRETEYR